jgi:superfamily II DNA or RNA helicase
MERVSRRDLPVEDFARRFQVVVVDESHNFRNPDANRWTHLFRLITQGDPEKKVILLTATPVNNTVFDLYHQLQFITRSNRQSLLSIGIPDLWEYFRKAEQNQEVLYEVLEALAVRRSRQFIRQHYPEAEIDGQKVRFPERALHTVQYSLQATYGRELYQKIADAIENLLLAPYQVETYRRELVEARRARVLQLPFFENADEEGSGAVERLQKALGCTQKEAHEFLMTIGRQTALAHIMRVLYLKRLESSVEALRISLRRLRKFLEAFRKALEHGRLLQSGDYRRWLQTEGTDEEGLEFEENFEVLLDTLPELPAERYDVEYIRAAVEADLHALEEILQELESERPDDKVETLQQLLCAPELQRRKVVVFSYFRDTARYLYRQLQHRLKDRLKDRRLAIVDSEVKPAERNERIVRFAPAANGRPDIPAERQIDLLISTDVLSEGQNLQDADVIINYDLPWNPVRLVQRIGRLDRLGSPHERIRIYNFFPEDELEALLGILERLQQKLDAINRTVGLDASVLGEKPNPMDFNTLRRLAQEETEVLRELEAESELTVGEFLQQDLLWFLKEVGEAHLQQIPLGVGTARKRAEGMPSGFFAAFRNVHTNQHHWLFYDTEKDRVLERRLEAIRAIRCEPSEPAATLPADFDPRPLIGKLRKHLWNRLRAARMAPGALPSLQRQIVSWLRALPPSAERNHLLQYFESRPLAAPDLKELRRLWQERTALPQEAWIQRLREFATSHPHSPMPLEEPRLPELREEDLECIAWVWAA